MNSSIARPIMIDINIGNQLTTISCGHVVGEIIKFIAYQRLQIPYSYQWLKQIVNKRKMVEPQDRVESLQSERHFRVASTALENLDFILKSLLQEISSASMPEEVCIVLGGSPVTCNEVYRLLLPTVCHQPQCHSSYIANDQKIHMNVFRELVTSDKLSEIFFNQLPPTSMYVFIKKKKVNNDVVLNHDNFIFTTGHRIPRSSKIVIIDFRSQNAGNITCCNDFQVFSDVINQDLVKLKIDQDSESCDDYQEIESTDAANWYQSAYVMKGFKDCIVDGSSVTSTWVES